MTRAWKLFVLAAALAGAPASAAVAQPAPPPPRDAEGERRGLLAPEALKQRLERRLEMVRAAQQRLTDALKRLEAGHDPADIERDLEPAAGPPGDRPRDRRDAFGDDRPPRGPEGRPEGRPGGPRGDGPPPPGDAPPGPPAPPGGRPGDPIDPEQLLAVLRNSGEPEGPLGVNSPRLRPEQRDRVRDFIVQRRPEIAERLAEFERSSPFLAERTLDGIGARLRGLLEARERDPAQLELRSNELRHFVEMTRLAGQFAQAKEAGQPERLAEIRAQLRAVMSEQFDLRAALRRGQVDQLRQRSENLAKELDQLETKRDEILDRAQTMLEEGTERFLRDRARRGREGFAPPPPPPPAGTRPGKGP